MEGDGCGVCDVAVGGEINSGILERETKAEFFVEGNSVGYWIGRLGLAGSLLLG